MLAAKCFIMEQLSNTRVQFIFAMITGNLGLIILSVPYKIMCAENYRFWNYEFIKYRNYFV